MAYRLLLSDADGTLFDFHAGERIAIADTFRAFGLPATEENAAVYHRVNEAQWKRLERGETTQPRLKVDRFADFLAETGYEADPQKMCEVFVRCLGRQRILLPGARDFCKRVAARMPIYLVTNGLSAVQRSRFVGCELAPYLSGLIISEEVGASKPDPAMIWEALRRAGDLRPADAVLLGDSLTADIPAARSAGVDSILFTNNEPPPAHHGANYTARTLGQAAEIVLGAGCAKDAWEAPPPKPTA